MSSGLRFAMLASAVIDGPRQLLEEFFDSVIGGRLPFLHCTYPLLKEFRF
jgi:hypothetical protein